MQTLREVIEANSELTQLLSYDSVWTGHSRDSRWIAENPFELLQIAQHFRLAIINAPHRVRYIEEVADAPEFADMPETLSAVLSQDVDGRQVLDAVQRHDGIAALAREATREVAEHEPDELRHLDDDLRRLLAGEIPEGYFWKKFMCGVAKASMVGGLLTVWIPPHAHAVPAVALGSKVYKTNHCGDE